MSKRGCIYSELTLSRDSVTWPTVAYTPDQSQGSILETALASSITFIIINYWGKTSFHNTLTVYLTNYIYSYINATIIHIETHDSLAHDSLASSIYWPPLCANCITWLTVLANHTTASRSIQIAGAIVDNILINRARTAISQHVDRIYDHSI